MIIVAQDGKSFVNFDFVKAIKLSDNDKKEVDIKAYLTDGTTELIATYNSFCKGKDVMYNLANSYKGNAVLKMPK